MCFNKTSINRQVVGKVLKACTVALSNESGVSYIDNKKGQTFIRVKRIKKKDGKIGFQVLDKKNKNLASLLADAVIHDMIMDSKESFTYASDLKNFLLKRVAFPFEIA